MTKKMWMLTYLQKEKWKLAAVHSTLESVVKGIVRVYKTEVRGSWLRPIMLSAENKNVLV